MIDTFKKGSKYLETTNGERIRIFQLPRSFDVALFANIAIFPEESRNLHIIAALLNVCLDIMGCLIDETFWLKNLPGIQKVHQS